MLPDVSHQPSLSVLPLGVTLLFALFVGAVIALFPVSAAFPVVALFGVLVLRYRLAAVSFLVFGGLIALQSSQELDNTKLIYLAGALVAFAGVTIRVLSAIRDMRLDPLLLIPALFAVLILVSFPVAIANGHDTSEWLRDVTPYLLFAVTPILAADAAPIQRRILIGLFAVAGSVTALSFVVEWLDRRRFAILPVERVGLPDFFLPAAVICLALVYGVAGNRLRSRWMFFGMFLIAAMLLTGTRSVLASLASLPATIVMMQGGLKLRALRALAALAAFVFVLSALVGVAIATEAIDVSLLEQRVALIPSVLAEPESDASYEDRTRQRDAVLRVFLDNPVFGAGPGVRFSWLSPFGVYRSTSVPDAPMPLLVLAKFGLFGFVVLLVVIVAWIALLRRIPGGAPRLALLSYSVVALAWSTFGSPFENKGFSFGLLFLLALALHVERDRDLFGVGMPVTRGGSDPAMLPPPASTQSAPLPESSQTGFLV
jgi:O-antigen ligase